MSHQNALNPETHTCAEPPYNFPITIHEHPAVVVFETHRDPHEMGSRRLLLTPSFTREKPIGAHFGPNCARLDAAGRHRVVEWLNDLFWRYAKDRLVAFENEKKLYWLISHSTSECISLRQLENLRNADRSTLAAIHRQINPTT
jgi:hypothetical protein